MCVQVKVQCNMDVSCIHRLFLTTLMKYEVCIIIMKYYYCQSRNEHVGMVKITVHHFRGVDHPPGYSPKHVGKV